MLSLVSLLLKIGVQLADSACNFAIHGPMHARKQFRYRDLENQLARQRRAKRRQPVTFFVPGKLRTVFPTHEESHLTLCEA